MGGKFPSPILCLVSRPGQRKQAQPASSLLLLPQAQFLFLLMLGAPSRWAALINWLQAREGILRHVGVGLWREGNLVNKLSLTQRKVGGEGQGKRILDILVTGSGLKATRQSPYWPSLRGITNPDSFPR